MTTQLRFLLAIALMIGVLVVTNMLFPPVPPEPVADTAVDTAASSAEVSPPPPAVTVDTGAVVATGAPPGPTPESLAAPAVEPERRVVVESPLYRHVFSTRGARLVSAELPAFASFTRPGPVQLIVEGDAALGLRLVTGSDTLDLRDLHFEPSEESVRIDSARTGQVTFQHESPGLVVEISYRFSADSYLIEAVGSVRGVERALLVADLGPGLPLNDLDQVAEERALAYVGNHLQEGIDSHPLRDVEGPVLHEGPFLWAAFKNKFFVFAVLPGTGGREEFLGGMLVVPEGETRARVAVTEAVSTDGEFAYRAFVGPQEYARLTELGGDLDEVNPYGWRIFRPVVRPLVGLITAILIFLHNTLNLAHGWVLVVFGVIMRVVLWPLNQKAMRAQMKNMAVQPLLKEIQTKYKDNPEKLQKEMMRLYKEYGFNPMAGCLPMLLPWPVLISLFFVFQNTIEFRGSSFLWLPDLSAPDPFFILPVFLGISMFFLQWISMRSMQEVNPQMKMMMWMMPIMMVFIFFRLAAGLNLYYSVSNLATIPQQYWIAKERERAQARGPVKLKTT